MQGKENKSEFFIFNVHLVSLIILHSATKQNPIACDVLTDSERYVPRPTRLFIYFRRSNSRPLSRSVHGLRASRRARSRRLARNNPHHNPRLPLNHPSSTQDHPRLAPLVCLTLRHLRPGTTVLLDVSQRRWVYHPWYLGGTGGSRLVCFLTPTRLISTISEPVMQMGGMPNDADGSRRQQYVFYFKQ